jgi:putative ABC transport system permease protein
MRAVRRLWKRLRGTWGQTPGEDDLRAEIEFHLQMEIDENLRRGLPPEEARRQALITFGGVEAAREDWREERRLPVLDHLLQDVRYGWRMLVKTRGATTAALVAFALGLGVNAAMYSVCEALVFRPLLLPDPDRLVVLPTTVRGARTGIDDVAPADFVDLRAQSRTLDVLSAAVWWETSLTGAGEPANVRAFRVSPSFFDALRARPLLGRGFARGEDVPGRDAVAVLGHGLWQRQFGGDPGVVGRRVRLGGREVDVIGVMPKEVRFPAEAELWVPLALSPEEWADRGTFYLYAVARLQAGVPLGQARAEVESIAARLAAAHPSSHEGRRLGVARLSDHISGDLTRGFSLMIMGVVGFVLLIACANVANLQFARIASRSRELAVRAALGAGRGRLARQLVVEGILLALLGGAVSLAFAVWAVDAIRSSMPAEVRIHLPGWDRMSVSPRALGFTLALALLSGVVAGLAAASAGSRGDLVQSLRDGARGATGGRHRLKGALVVCQIVLALVLLAGAGLMVRGFRVVADPLPGSEPERVLTFRLSLAEARYPKRSDQAAFAERAMERLRALPSVVEGGLSSSLPYSGYGSSSSLVVEGRLPPPGAKEGTRYQPVSPGLFDTLRIPVHRGRDFTEADGRDAPPVAIVNEAFVRRYLPDREPLGRRVRIGADGEEGPWLTVVGVVADVLHDWVDRAPRPTLFRPFVQRPRPSFQVALRTRGAPADAVAEVRAALRAVDPDQPISDVLPLSKMIGDYLVGLEYVAGMMGVFGLIAVWLAVVGIYSVMSFEVVERTREIGVRMALGATVREVVLLVVRRGALLAGIGLVVGLGAAILAARGLASLIYGVSASDVTALGGVSLLLAAAALAACAIPARRAARVDPLICLRVE